MVLLRFLLGWILIVTAAAESSPPNSATDLKHAHDVLDQLHHAASQAEGEAYFALFAPDAVFLGTDATERWTLAEFKAYALPYFSAGRGWTYVTTERHLNLAADGGHASFDELLEHASFGQCRGTGVLRRINGQWKIEQYHLTIPLPNAIARDVVAMIKTQAADAPPPASDSPAAER